MKRVFVKVSLAIFVALYLSYESGVSLDSTLPSAKPIQVEELPVVDGILPEWLQESAPSLSLNKLWQAEGEPEQETRVWLLTDGSWLYVGVDCIETERPVRAEVSEPGTPALFMDDHVEVFVQGGDEHYYHFAVSAGGADRAQKVVGSLRILEGLPDYEKAVSVRDDGWSVEYTLPLHMLWPDKILGTPRFNITRTRQNTEPEQITWVDLGDGRSGFHQPDKFGKLSGLEGLVLPHEPRFRVDSGRISEPPIEKNGQLSYLVRARVLNEGNSSGQAIPVVVEKFVDGQSHETTLDPIEIPPGEEIEVEARVSLSRTDISRLHLEVRGAGDRITKGSLRGLSFLHAGTGAWGEKGPDFPFGAFAGSFHEPIGGGVGYSEPFMGGTESVGNRDDFLLALEQAASLKEKERDGFVIYIEGDAVIDFTGWKTADEVGPYRPVVEIPDGIVVAGNRGVDGSKGPLLRMAFTDEELAAFGTSQHPWMNKAFIQLGNGSRLTGVRVEGPDPPSRYGPPLDWSAVPEDDPGQIWAKHTVQSRFNGVRLGDDAQVDNCEISNFQYSGLSTSRNTRSRMLCNTIRDVHAYPVLVGNSAYADVEGNRIYWSWHAIAGGGTPDSGYAFRNNIVIHDGQGMLGHAIDMHAWRAMMRGGQPGAQPPYIDIAGDEIIVEYNTFLNSHEGIVRFRELRGMKGDFLGSMDVRIRGVPRVGAMIRYNWFANALPDLAVVQSDNIGGLPGVFSRANLLIENNVHGPDRRRVPVAMESLPFIRFQAPALEVPRDEETRLWSTHHMNPHPHGEPYTVLAEVSPLPDAPIEDVRILVGKEVVYESEAPPGEDGIVIDTSGLPHGPNVVTVIIRDTKGREARHDSVFNLLAGSNQEIID